MPDSIGSGSSNNDIKRGKKTMPASSSGAGALCAGVCASLCVVAGATAQEASQADESGAVLAEVMVTATRQSENLSRVPLSVTAFTQQQLQDIGAKKVDDVIRQTPGISIARSTNSPLGATVTVRGIAAGGVGAGTTGVYIDDTPVQARTIGFSSSSAFPVVFDLARVEVLRGPQGTLFGAGAEGGAIRFISPEPGFDHFSGSARGEFSATEYGDPNYEVGVAGGGPVVGDRLAFRGSAYYRRDGGFVDRVPQGSTTVAERDSNWSTSAAARAALAWRATDSLIVTPSLFWQRLRSNGSGAFWERESDEDSGRFVNGNKFDEPFTDQFTLPALKLEWHLGSVDFISSSSYFLRHSLGFNDYTIINAATHSGTGYLSPAIAGFYSTAEQGNDQKNYNQELRLQSNNPEARFNWVVGLFAERNQQKSLQQTVSPGFMQMWETTHPGRTFVSAFGRPLLPGGIYLVSNVRAIDRQTALFAQTDFRATEKLKVTAGVRYARTKFKYDAAYDGPSNGPAFFTDAGEQAENPVTPKLGLSYQFDPDNMLYTSASKGFRPGGAQAKNPPLCQPELTSLGYATPPTSFDSDSVWAYEIGSKNRLASGRLRIDASVYWIDWTNIQRSVPLISCARNFVANLGTATSRGFDLSAQTLLGEHLTLGLSVGYTRAELAEDVLGGTATGGARRILVAKGDALGQRPWTGTLNAEQTFTLMGQNAFVRADYTYNSKQSSTAVNNPISASYDVNLVPDASYDVLNLRTGLRLQNMDVSLFINNALDEAPIFGRAHASRTSTLYTLSTLTPRTVGVTASYKF
jgi:outer membrane receptor protein involved in Fe transport